MYNLHDFWGDYGGTVIIIITIVAITLLNRVISIIAITMFQGTFPFHQ